MPSRADANAPGRSPRRWADEAARRSGLDLLAGPPSVLVDHLRQRWRGHTPADALPILTERLRDDDPPDEAPLFLLSAGWRSGSTLLQRLVVSGRTHFIWGEPYALSDPVRRLADSLAPFATGWPPQSYLIDAGPGLPDMTTQWVANLYPSVSSLIEAHRAYYRRLFRDSLPDPEAEWGFKEVRLGVEHAAYLRFLFPRCRILLLVRDPQASFASYKRWSRWYDRWPDRQVRTAWAFGRMWRRLAGGFHESWRDVDALLVRYEDLRPGGPALRQIGDYLGYELDAAVLETRAKGVPEDAVVSPSSLERRVLWATTMPVARHLGYG